MKIGSLGDGVYTSTTHLEDFLRRKKYEKRAEHQPRLYLQGCIITLLFQNLFESRNFGSSSSQPKENKKHV